MVFVGCDCRLLLIICMGRCKVDNPQVLMTHDAIYVELSLDKIKYQ